MSLLCFSIDFNLKRETDSIFTFRMNPGTQDEIQSSGITFFSKCLAETINMV